MGTSALLERLSLAGVGLAPVLLDAAAKGVVVLALAGLVTLALRRASAAARHLVWALGTLSLLMLPVLSAALPGWYILPPVALGVGTAGASAAESAPLADPPTAPLAEPATGARVPDPVLGYAPEPWLDLPSSGARATAETPAGPVAAPPASAAPPTATAPAHWAWQTWLMLAWLLGSAGLLARIGLGFLSLGWLERRSTHLTDGTWPILLRQLAAQLGLRRPVTLLSSGRRTMPMTWGLWRTRLLLPADAADWPTEQCRTVLLHELAHAKRGDCLMQLIAQMACAVYWFNPLVWLAWRRMQTERERACDDLVLSTGTKASAYAEQLLHIAAELPAVRFSTAAIAMARPSKLEGRLLAILDVRRSRRGVTRGAALLAGLALLAIVGPLAVLRAGEGDASGKTGAAGRPVEQGSLAAAEPDDPNAGAPMSRPAAEALDRALAATRQYDGWIHAERRGPDPDNVNRRHINTRDHTFIAEDHTWHWLSVRFSSPGTKEYLVYDSSYKSIARTPYTPEIAESSERDYVRALPGSLIDDAARRWNITVFASTEGAFDKYDIAVSDAAGQTPKDAPLTQLSVLVDPRTQLVQAMRYADPQLSSKSIYYTYGPPEFTSIYDVGVPRDAPVVEASDAVGGGATTRPGGVATSQPSLRFEPLRPDPNWPEPWRKSFVARRRDYGDHLAVICASTGTPGGITIDWRRGDDFGLLNYNASVSWAGSSFEQWLRERWPNLTLAELLPALSAAKADSFYVCLDGTVTSPACVQNGWQREVRKVAGPTDGQASVLLTSAWPLDYEIVQTMRCDVQLVREPNAAHPDWVGVDVFELPVKTRRQPDPPPRHVARAWLDPQRDFFVREYTQELPARVITSRVLDTAQAPNGNWYPRRWSEDIRELDGTGTRHYESQVLFSADPNVIALAVALSEQAVSDSAREPTSRPVAADPNAAAPPPTSTPTAPRGAAPRKRPPSLPFYDPEPSTVGVGLSSAWRCLASDMDRAHAPHAFANAATVLDWYAAELRGTPAEEWRAQLAAAVQGAAAQATPPAEPRPAWLYDLRLDRLMQSGVALDLYVAGRQLTEEQSPAVIRGTVFLADGQPASYAELLLEPRLDPNAFPRSGDIFEDTEDAPRAVKLGFRGTRADAAGHFELRSLAGERYLTAWHDSGTATITIEPNRPPDVDVHLRSWARVHGRLDPRTFDLDNGELGVLCEWRQTGWVSDLNWYAETPVVASAFDLTRVRPEHVWLQWTVPYEDDSGRYAGRVVTGVRRLDVTPSEDRQVNWGGAGQVVRANVLPASLRGHYTIPHYKTGPGPVVAIVKFERNDDPGAWFNALVSDDGSFERQLPAGTYTAKFPMVQPTGELEARGTSGRAQITVVDDPNAPLDISDQLAAGASQPADPNAAAPAPPSAPGARTDQSALPAPAVVAAEFLGHVARGEFDAAISLGTLGWSSPDALKETQSELDYGMLHVETAYVGSEQTAVLTNAIDARHGTETFKIRLAFTLKRSGERWLIRDIDAPRDEPAVQKWLAAFRRVEPQAETVTLADAAAAPPVVAPERLPFEKVVEWTLKSPAVAPNNAFVDLDTGRVCPLPGEVKPDDWPSMLAWARRQGVDAIGDTREDVRGLQVCAGPVARLTDADWDHADVEKVSDALAHAGFVAQKFAAGGADETWVISANTVSTDPFQTRTFAVRTDQDSLAIVQLQEVKDEPSGFVRFRYRLLDPRSEAPPPPTSARRANDPNAASQAAAEDLDRALAATRQYAGWIHAVKTSPDPNRATRAHINLRDNTVVLISQNGAVLFSSPATKQYLVYESSAGTITRRPLTPELARTVDHDRDKPMPDTLIASLRRGWQIDVSAGTEGALTKYDVTVGAAIDPNTTGRPFGTISVLVDPRTQLIQEVRGLGPLPGPRSFFYTYGPPSIESIYDAGVPRDAKVVDAPRATDRNAATRPTSAPGAPPAGATPPAVAPR